MTDRGPAPHRPALAAAAAGTATFASVTAAAIWPADTPDAAVLGALTLYWAGLALAWAVLTAWAVRLCRDEDRAAAVDGQGGGDAASFGRAAITILLVALLLRVMVAATTTPVLSDDIWRYLFDGWTLAGGDNPYRLSPLERAQEPPTSADPMAQGRTLAWVAWINHPHLVTIYQPPSQWVFAAMWSLGAENSTRFRLGFSLVDVAVVGLLLLGLRQAGASPWWAALYAWHPLAISETAGSGHQDVLGILPLVGALVLSQSLTRLPRHDRPLGEWPGGSAAVGALLALAAAVKPIAAPLAAPVMWEMVRGRRRKWAAAGMLASAALAGAAIIAALYLPFALMPGGLDGMLQTARTFVDDWAFNGSVHPLLSTGLGEPAADWICGGLLVAAVLTAMALKRDAIECAIAYLLAALLLSSTAHPWYLLWALALAPLRPRFALSPAVWVWSLTIAGTYAAHATPGYRVPAWVAAVEYLPVYATLAATSWLALRRR